MVLNKGNYKQKQKSHKTTIVRDRLGRRSYGWIKRLNESACCKSLHRLSDKRAKPFIDSRSNLTRAHTKVDESAREFNGGKRSHRQSLNSRQFLSDLFVVVFFI